jgi:hypothetical protein
MTTPNEYAIPVDTSPPPPVELVNVGDGVYLHPDQVAAAYVATEGVWTDVPEARPRARIRTSDGEGNAVVTVDVDGGMHWHPGKDVVVDRYDGDEYAAIRAEGEERWARVDAARAAAAGS